MTIEYIRQPGPTTTAAPPLDRRRTGTFATLAAETSTSSAAREERPRITACSGISQSRKMSPDISLASEASRRASSRARLSAGGGRIRARNCIDGYESPRLRFGLVRTAVDDFWIRADTGSVANSGAIHVCV